MNTELLKNIIKQFVPFAQKHIGFKKPPRLFLRNDVENAKNPFVRVGGTLLSFGSGLIGLGGAFSPQLVSLLDQTEVSNAISGNVTDMDSLLQNIQQSNIPNIEVVPTERPPQSVGVEGRSALLMVTPSVNGKNPYLLNSHLQYNVIPV